MSTILWITLTQVVASGMGGYLAGRLRARWIEVQRDEVYFRDTAHGFLAWAVASLATAVLLSSVIGSIVSTGVQAGASVAGGVVNAATTGATAAAATSAASPDGAGNGMDPTAYFVDSLFRPDLGVSAAAAATTARAGATGERVAVSTSITADPAGVGTTPIVVTPRPALATTPATPPAPATAAEVARIFVNALRDGALPPEDARYVGQLVSQRTGLSQADAEKRVTDTFNRAQTKLKNAETAAKEAADKARKASAYGALWLFISLLGGAFIASYAATFGGRQRDL
ncbi:MAG: hypothetical protein EOP40_07760 [Rubrivivax sp.]|nr:MAG: hypothetical protein EOP40_07760 [Rubrivivax sp.]